MGIVSFEPGRVVLSRAGRDCGRLMIVLEAKDGLITVADGKERPLERPKRKNPRHLQKTGYTVSLEALTNKKLKIALRAFSEHDIAEESDKACLKKM